MLALHIFIVNVYPWLVSTACLYLLFPTTKKYSLQQNLFFICFGLVGGYFLVSLGIFLLLKLHFSPLPFGVVLFFILVACSCLVLRLILNKLQVYDEKHPTLSGTARKDLRTKNKLLPSVVYLALIYALINLTFIGMENWLRPVVSWDAIWFWTDLAYQQLQNINAGSMKLVEQEGHPRAVVFILTWIGFWTNIFSTNGPVLLPWLLIYVATITVILVTVFQMTRNLYVFSVGFLLLSGGATAASHVALHGYADLWIASAFVMALSALAYMKIDGDSKKPMTFLSILFLSILPLLKLTGIIYILIIILAITTQYMIAKRRWKSMATFWLSGLAAGITILNVGFSLDSQLIKISVSPEDGIVTLGNREMWIPDASLREVLMNLWEAFFISSSFGIALALATMLSIMNLYFALKSERPPIVTASLTLVISIGFFACLQFLSNYALGSSSGSGGTGLVRATLFLHFLSPLVLAEFHRLTFGNQKQPLLKHE